MPSSDHGGLSDYGNGVWHVAVLSCWGRTCDGPWPRIARIRAKVALARKLAVVLHRLWAEGTEFRWSREAAASV
jgi:hypothetical protein